MTVVYDWAAEGAFDDDPPRALRADDVRRALVDVASGRLPGLATLRRAVGVSTVRALAVRDHLASLSAPVHL